MMVLRSRGRQICLTPEGPQRIEVEDPLNGVVLEIKAMNLPFIFVTASCPIRGQQNLLVDVRKYDFIKVNREFADAVIGAVQTDEAQSESVDLEQLCGHLPENS